MIRDYKVEDLDRIIETVKEGCILTDDDIRGDIEGTDTTVLVYDDNGIIGLGIVKISDKESKTCRIMIYVSPKERRKGIGTKLYLEITKYLYNIKPNLLIARFRIDKNDSSPFFNKLGYKKWFGLCDMVYKSGPQPHCDLEFVQYRDEYFEQYAKGINDCFYEMRKENDIKPYHCFDANEENRKSTLTNKDNIYVHFEGDKLIASVIVKDGYIDDLFVRPEYQGRGYGRSTTQFAINKALSQGAETLYLGAVEWNTKAINLYKSLGFQIIQTFHTVRQFGDK